MTRSYPTERRSTECCSSRRLLAAPLGVDSRGKEESTCPRRHEPSWIEMSLRKALSRLAFLVFPLALLLVYWENAYFDGHPFDRTIHLTTVLGSRGAGSCSRRYSATRKPYRKRSWSFAISRRRPSMYSSRAPSEACCSCRSSCSSRSGFSAAAYFRRERPAGAARCACSSFSLALLYELLRYSIHRVQHIVPFLWELHSYHHRASPI